MESLDQKIEEFQNEMEAAQKKYKVTTDKEKLRARVRRKLTPSQMKAIDRYIEQS